MIPSPWIAVLLVMAAYRLTRLAGWDDFPPIVKLRALVLGERWVPTEQTAHDVELPGKTPDSEVEWVRPAYDRPLLAHLFHCPFCIGWWISASIYALWAAVGAPGALPEHSWVMYLLTPFAISGAVGLVAKNLDA